MPIGRKEGMRATAFCNLVLHRPKSRHLKPLRMLPPRVQADFLLKGTHVSLFLLSSSCAEVSVLSISFLKTPAIRQHLPRVTTLLERKILTSKPECFSCKLQLVGHGYPRGVALRMPRGMSSWMVICSCDWR